MGDGCDPVLELHLAGSQVVRQNGGRQPSIISAGTCRQARACRRHRCGASAAIVSPGPGSGTGERSPSPG
jgi:hypothetical protein